MEAMISLAALAAIFLSSPQEPPPEFELLYLAVHGRRQDTVGLDFDGDGLPDLLDTAVDYDASPPVRWLFLHRQTKERSFRENPDFVWKLSDRAAAMVYGDFLPGGGHDIAFIAPDGLYVYPWENGAIVETPRKLLHLRTFFHEAPERSIPIWWSLYDLDGNGLHDLILPVPDGYRVYFQTAKGIYGSVCAIESDLAAGQDRALGAARFAAVNDLVSAFLSSSSEIPRLHPADIDGDGRLDLVSIDGDVLTAFFQKDPGSYSSRRGDRVRYPIPSLQEERKKDHVSLSLVSFLHLDADPLADLVVTRVQGTLGFLESIRTNFFLHRGNGRGNFVPDSVIKIDGVSLNPLFVDMNGDGALDCLVSRLRTDLLAQAVKALVLGDVAITYEIFQFEPATGRYIETPVWSRDVFVTVDDVKKKGAGSAPALLIQGDFSGDRRPDLVSLDPKSGALEMYRGVEGRFGSRRLIDFERTPFRTVPLRRHPNWMTIYDANGDGISDVLLLHHGTAGLVLSKQR